MVALRHRGAVAGGDGLMGDKQVSRTSIEPYFSAENITEPFRRILALLQSMNIHGRNFALSIPELEVAAAAADSAHQAILDAGKTKQIQETTIERGVDEDYRGKTVQELMERDYKEPS